MNDVRLAAPSTYAAAFAMLVAAIVVLGGPSADVVHAQQSPTTESKSLQGPVGWIQIFTNYDAVVTVDGQPYPKRADNGMKVTANETHAVHVKMGDKEKNYTVVVEARELRTLLVDLSGYQTPPSPATAKSSGGKSTSKAKEAKEESDDTGKLTVYSKPKGDVYVDSTALGASTPMINRELDIGRHEVQVKWESGDMSEVKTIRIRKGSKLKLFFRDRKSKLGKN